MTLFKEFKILSSENLSDLEQQVNELFTDDPRSEVIWQPFGNLVVTQDVKDSRSPRVVEKFFMTLVRVR